MFSRIYPQIMKALSTIDWQTKYNLFSLVSMENVLETQRINRETFTGANRSKQKTEDDMRIFCTSYGSMYFANKIRSYLY